MRNACRVWSPCPYRTSLHPAGLQRGAWVFGSLWRHVVACGEWHTLAVDVEGALWAFGNNDEAQLGLGHSGGKVRVGWLELESAH